MVKGSYSNSGSFAAGVLTLGTTMPAKQVSTAMKKLSIDALTSLVTMTPVDTGRARGNWNVTITAPSTSKAVESRKDKNGDSTIARGTSTITKATSKPKPPKVIYITNNVWYIADLENGKSRQSEAMLKRTVNNLTLKHGVSTESDDIPF